MYAITNEYPAPITLRIMIEAISKKTVRVNLKGLRRDIGRILLSSEPNNLNEAEKKAADVKRYLQEEIQWQKKLPVQTSRPIPPASKPQGIRKPFNITKEKQKEHQDPTEEFESTQQQENYSQFPYQPETEPEYFWLTQEQE
ncbi:hypothetical protein ANTPLA_LOCUS2694 [Anthophora plagiata]